MSTTIIPGFRLPASGEAATHRYHVRTGCVFSNDALYGGEISLAQYRSDCMLPLVCEMQHIDEKGDAADAWADIVLESMGVVEDVADDRLELVADLEDELEGLSDPIARAAQLVKVAEVRLQIRHTTGRAKILKEAEAELALARERALYATADR